MAAMKLLFVAMARLVVSIKMNEAQPTAGYYQVPCESCPTGQHRSGCAGNSPGECEQNICHCDNGVGKTGAACNEHNKTMCTSCTGNYHLDDDVCEPNQCSCDKGFAVRSDQCTTHQANSCQSCDTPHHLENDTCVENVCDCSNGSPVASSVCTTHGAIICATCAAHYHLGSSSGCEENTCGCTHGAPVANAACVTHQANECQSCSGHYHLDNRFCEANTCQCRNGFAVAYASCTSHQADECASCLGNYHLENLTCVENVCECQDGVHVANANCTVHLATQCSSCTGNYHVENGACVPNVCTCPNGVPVNSSDCAVHQAIECSDCTGNFHMDTGVCAYNVCTCANGVAMGAAQCTANGANFCSSCIYGYHFDGTSCVASKKIELGTFTISGTAWTSVSFHTATTGAFQEAPVVVAMMTNAGSHPSNLRIKDVTPLGFKVATTEASGTDGPHPGISGDIISYLAVVPGSHMLGSSSIVAGTLSTQHQVYKDSCTGGSGSGTWDELSFEGFLAAPVLLAGLQTMANEPNFTHAVSQPFMDVAIKLLNNTGAQIAIERAETVGSESSPDLVSAETIGYIGISQSTGTFTSLTGASVSYEVALSQDVFKGWDETARSHSFSQSFASAPLVVAHQDSRDGSNGGWARLYSATATEVKFVVDEDKSCDTEREHTTEKVGFLAASQTFSA